MVIYHELHQLGKNFQSNLKQRGSKGSEHPTGLQQLCNIAIFCREPLCDCLMLDVASEQLASNFANRDLGLYDVQVRTVFL